MSQPGQIKLKGCKGFFLMGVEVTYFADVFLASFRAAPARRAGKRLPKIGMSKVYILVDNTQVATDITVVVIHHRLIFDQISVTCLDTFQGIFTASLGRKRLLPSFFFPPLQDADDETQVTSLSAGRNSDRVLNP